MGYQPLLDQMTIKKDPENGTMAWALIQFQFQHQHHGFDCLFVLYILYRPSGENFLQMFYTFFINIIFYKNCNTYRTYRKLKETITVLKPLDGLTLGFWFVGLKRLGYFYRTFSNFLTTMVERFFAEILSPRCIFWNKTNVWLLLYIFIWFIRY